MNENIKNQFSEKIRPVFEKLKKDKKALVIILLGLLGMLMILFSGSDKNTDTDKSSVNENSTISQYEIKKDVTELIKSIKGAGETQVMITYECAEETVYATDTEEQAGENDVQLKKEHIIVENDSGETGLMITVIYPKVQGVAVICEGGDDPIVKEKIYSLISALFDINSNSISVASMA